MYDIEFNGRLASEYGIFPVDKYINIPSAERDISTIEVKGRDGELHIDNKRWKPIQFPINFNYKFRNTHPNKVQREVKKWLKGSGILRIGYDDDYFYKVYEASISNIDIKSGKVDFVTNFKCEPFAYSQEGTYELFNPKELYNSGYSSNPVYRIVGEGMCELAVNDNSITINVGQEAIIDIDKLLCYREGVNLNTTVNGDISKLVLQEGMNTISITDSFELYIKPGWRDLI